MRAIFFGGDTGIADVATSAIHLRWPEVSPIVVTSATSALNMIRRESLDVVLLHPDLADMTLIDFIREVRGSTNVPLLVLSEQRDETEVVTALEVGADDYLRLPCDLTEIMIRIWALVRRAELPASSEEDGGHLGSGPLSLDPTTYEVSLGGHRLPLTPMEFRLLYYLVKKRGAVVAHQTMEMAVWSGRMDRSWMAKWYVKQLRDKLGDDAREPRWIANVHGVGYRFVGPYP